MTTPAARTRKAPGLVLGTGLSFLLSTTALPALAQEQLRFQLQVQRLI